VDDRGGRGAVAEHEVKGHLPAPVRDREAVDLRLVEAGGAAAPLRHVAGLGDELEREETPNAAVAGRDGDLVPLGDLLSGQRLLVQGDEDPERVVIQEGLPVLVVQEELLRDELRVRRRAGTSR